MTGSDGFHVYVEQVRQANDIYPVIGDYIELRGMKGICPFHDDTTPSLSVNTRKQFFHCFGCGAAGDVFKFVQLAEKVTFIEAVRRLAGRAGISPPEAPARSRSDRTGPAKSTVKDQPPPKAEAEDLWNRADRLSTDPEAVEWFCYRYQQGEAEKILQLAEDWDLVRVLPRQSAVPQWARSHLGSWTESGHRLLFRLWDAQGQCAALRARCIHRVVTPKSLAPCGFAVKGLVLADPLAVQLLSGVIPDWWFPREVVISEGEPDWLVWAAQQSDARESGPAYFGVESGSWTTAISHRIPTGSEVAIRTHDDEAGDRYAELIRASLGSRCSLYRSVEIAA